MPCFSLSYLLWDLTHPPTEIKALVCLFGQSFVVYLGHIIFVERLTPSTLCNLQGFLGLAGYYCKFVRNFRIIAKPLTDLLCKDSFKWSTTTDQAFFALKLAKKSTLVPTLLDFTKLLRLNTMPSIVVLERFYHRTTTLLSFVTNHWLQNIMFSRCMYDKEMLLVVFAVQKGRPYLLDH